MYLFVYPQLWTFWQQMFATFFCQVQDEAFRGLHPWFVGGALGLGEEVAVDSTWMEQIPKAGNFLENLQSPNSILHHQNIYHMEPK